MKYQRSGKSLIAEYILDHQYASKTELAKELGLSMPTVLQNTKELMEAGIMEEVGELASTGGRKAKMFALCGRAACAAGLDITANHIGLVLMDLSGEILKWERIRKSFENSLDYCRSLKQELEHFLETSGYSMKEILGIGVALPGIVSDSRQLLLKSHALQQENVSLKMLAQILDKPVYFENDANAAMLAEQMYQKTDAVYLSLSNTVGGAVTIGGRLFSGDGQKAGEFGHMVIVPKGRRCYCGKEGCMDAYCSPLALTQDSGDTLEGFMEKVDRREPSVLQKWKEYLEYLAIAVTNLRMAYDMNIILGGYMGKYLETHMLELGERVLRYNMFDRDISYLRCSHYKTEGAAAGAAVYFIHEFVNCL